MLVRDVLSCDVLVEEAAEEEAWIDDSHALATARARRRLAVERLGELPDGFKVERLRGRGRPGRDPGLELTLIDERGRPPRVVGVVARRRVGVQRLTWTAKQLVDPASAEAFGVVLRLAALDAEGR